MLSLMCTIPSGDAKRLLEAHVQLQLGCYFSESEKCLSGLLCTSKWIEDHYWNSFCAFRETDLEGMLAKVVEMFGRKGRSPAFYIDPGCSPEVVGEFLSSRGYSTEKEVWMMSGGLRRVDRPKGVVVSRATMRDKEDCLRVFSVAFGGEATSADGYGNIPPAYLSALEDSFGRGAGMDVEHVHLVAKMGGETVGCGSVHVGKGYAGLYNVGTLPGCRGRGVGTAVSLEGFRIAQDKGIREVFLQTQPGGAVQRFYEGMGCRVVFEGAIVSKSGE